MSDAVRNYSGMGGRLSSRAWKSRGGNLRRLGILLVLVLIGLWWMTRDGYDISGFMPAGLRYSIVLADPVNGKERLVSSDVWNAWPDPALRETVLKNLQKDPGVPRWVLNNLLTERLYLFGNDVRNFSDVIALTRMSRIGVLLETFHSFFNDVTSDYAGGLRLRRITSSGVYYAVRGRVLLLSPNRESLIRALTLQKEDILDDGTRDDLTRQGAEDVRGAVQLGADDPLGDAFQSIAFAIRVDQDRAYAKCHGIIRDTARLRFGPLLNGAKPFQLAEPIPGAIEISANFGKPVREVWASLGEAMQSSWLNAAQWQIWESPGPDSAPTVSQTITGLLGPLGPGIRLTCTRLDLNEMLPVPEIIGTLEAPNNALPKLDALPPPPPEAKPWDTYPRYNAETKIVHVPIVGGPSMEPSAAIYGQSLLISTSLSAAQSTLKAAPLTGALTEQANLFIRVRPRDVAENVIGALRLIAESGTLRGYDSVETFDQAAAGWRASASRVSEVAVVASGAADAIDAELRVICAAPLAATASMPPAESAS